jgi:hypothetical protein
MGFMLVPDQSGLMVGRKQQMLDQVVPSEQEYGSSPVYRERTSILRPTAGYGERVQSSYGDRRYYWGKNIQIDGGLFGKGPLIHPVAPAVASGGWVYKFIDIPSPSGVFFQAILSGTKVYIRVDDTDVGQAVDKDFGAGNFVTDAQVYKGGFAGAAPSLYVSTITGQLWERTPAGTWTLCALPAGFGAVWLEVVGTELWAADMNNCVLRKVTSDPKVAGNWSGPFFIGDPSVAITAIRQTSNQLCIFKSDGDVFTLNSDGSSNDLFPGIGDMPDTENGKRAAAWMNSLWFAAGPSFYRLDMPGAQLTPMGPGRLLENASPVRGESRTFCGWGGYRAYLTLWNPETNTSYLLSYGNWETRATEQGQTVAFDDQWDGSMAEWAGRKATAMAVSSASGHDRLYIGFDDGKWDWIKLVKYPLGYGAPGAVGPGDAEFTTDPTEIVFPLHTAMFSADIKHWLGFSLFGPGMNPGDEVQLYYRLMASAGSPPLDPTSEWLYIGEFIKNGQRIPAPANLTGNGLSLKAVLLNTNQQDSPVIEVVAIHERVVPAFKRDLQFTFDARGFQTRLDGATVRYDSDRAHKVLMDFASAPGSMAIELPDETINEVALFGYEERLLPMQAGGGRSWGIGVQLTQFRILTRYGIIRRLLGTKIGDLAGYSVESLKAL